MKVYRRAGLRFLRLLLLRMRRLLLREVCLVTSTGRWTSRLRNVRVESREWPRLTVERSTEGRRNGHTVAPRSRRAWI
jgi:hypothetical protein